MIRIPQCIQDGLNLVQLRNIFPNLGSYLAGNTPLLVPAYPWVAVEGVDGSGKGSFLVQLMTRLESLHETNELIQMPGGTDFGLKLRECMKAVPPTLVGSSVIVPAMAANTADVLARRIVPHIRLEAHRARTTLSSPCLLSDRWPAISGAVYQRDYFSSVDCGAVRLADVWEVYGPICPPLLVYMKVSTAVSLMRRPAKGDGDQFEASEAERAQQAHAYELLFGEMTKGLKRQDLPADSAFYYCSDFTRPSVLVVDNQGDHSIAVTAGNMGKVFAPFVDCAVNYMATALRGPASLMS